MFGWLRRVIPSNGRVMATTYYVPDAFARQAASLGVATNTFSPMSTGTSAPGASSRGPMGLPGYGVNRFDGALAYQLGTKQDLHVPPQPILDPRSRRVGIGAGVSGQPGLPSSGDDASGYGSLLTMSRYQVGRGMGL